VVLYPDVVPFADNRFDCWDLFQRSVIHHGTDKTSGISSSYSCKTNRPQTIGSKRRTSVMTSDEEVGRQILNIFMKHHVGASGVLRRNNFVEVRDADFQRGLNKAVENRWIKIKLRDRYTYELTEAGLAAGLNAGFPSKPSV
jgi:hypothetical protein